TKGSRNPLTHELATHMRYVCDYDVKLMMQVIPCYDGFSDAEKKKCIESAVSGKRTAMSGKMRDVISYIQQKKDGNLDMSQNLDEAEKANGLYYYHHFPKLPPAIKASIAAVGQNMAMPILLTISPAIGALATGVKLYVHGDCRNLNLHAFLCGQMSSNKGRLDDIKEAWTYYLQQQDDILIALEKDYKRKKRLAKNQKEQPKEEVFPIRILTMNSTIPNLADRLGNLNGIHAFSYTCEADTVSQRWGKSLPEFSVMIRQAYDGSRFEREAKSDEAVSVHIPHLLWNTVLCGTPDALYRMYPNCKDGTVSRVMLATTPDNTYDSLETKIPELTPALAEKIHEVAQLLPLMKGEINSKRLEDTGREWLEDIRLESIKEADPIKARFRMRTCVNAQRVVGCLLVVAAATRLIEKHGLEGARQQLEADPECWLPLLPSLMRGKFLSIFNLVADYLLENSLHYFRKKMEEADSELSQIVSGNRQRTGKNDNIYAQLPDVFTFEQAFNIGKNVRGNGYTMNSCQQMIKNWKRQGLIEPIPDNKFRKLNSKTSYSQVG
nr:DUF3987 domain-containing protein [Bacteroidaceae bacterium]